MKIQFKLILVGFVVIAVLMAVVGFVSVNTFQKLSQEIDFVFTVVDPTQDANVDLRIAFEEEVRAIEEYAGDYTTREKAEEEIEEQEAIIRENLERLGVAAAAAGLITRDDVSSLKTIIAKEDQLREEIFRLKEQGLVQELRTGPMKELDETVEDIDELSKNINVSLLSVKEARKGKVTAAAAAAGRILTVGIIAAVLLALGMGVFVSRSVAKPLKALRDAATAFAQGNMDVAINTSGKDEIAELAQAFEKMRVSLKVVMEEYKKKIK